VKKRIPLDGKCISGVSLEAIQRGEVEFYDPNEEQAQAPVAPPTPAPVWGTGNASAIKRLEGLIDAAGRRDAALEVGDGVAAAEAGLEYEKLLATPAAPPAPKAPATPPGPRKVSREDLQYGLVPLDEIRSGKVVLNDE
jgi:hypothetical protein